MPHQRSPRARSPSPERPRNSDHAAPPIQARWIAHDRSSLPSRLHRGQGTANTQESAPPIPLRSSARERAPLPSRLHRNQDPSRAQGDTSRPLSFRERVPTPYPPSPQESESPVHDRSAFCDLLPGLSRLSIHRGRSRSTSAAQDNVPESPSTSRPPRTSDRASTSLPSGGTRGSVSSPSPRSHPTRVPDFVMVPGDIEGVDPEVAYTAVPVETRGSVASSSPSPRSHPSRVPDFVMVPGDIEGLDPEVAYTAVPVDTLWVVFPSIESWFGGRKVYEEVLSKARTKTFHIYHDYERIPHTAEYQMVVTMKWIEHVPPRETLARQVEDKIVRGLDAHVNDEDWEVALEGFEILPPDDEELNRVLGPPEKIELDYDVLRVL